MFVDCVGELILSEAGAREKLDHVAARHHSSQTQLKRELRHQRHFGPLRHLSVTLVEMFLFVFQHFHFLVHLDGIKLFGPLRCGLLQIISGNNHAAKLNDGCKGSRYGSQSTRPGEFRLSCLRSQPRHVCEGPSKHCRQDEEDDRSCAEKDWDQIQLHQTTQHTRRPIRTANQNGNLVHTEPTFLAKNESHGLDEI